MERILKQTHIHLTNGDDVPTYEKIDSILKKCTSSSIIRCHESYALSLMQIIRWQNEEILIEHNKKIPISHRYRSAVRNAILKYATGGDSNDGQ